MIISVHMPKTAGSSLAQTLSDHFGERLLRDYADLPLNTPVNERNLSALQESLRNADRDYSQIACVHGHFLPLKYLTLSLKGETKYITWLRDPCERLASHYWFWKKTYDPSTSPALHRRVIEENWTLERFCLGAELKNLYRQFLWGFPLDMFCFIGIVEHYEADFAYFTKTFLGVDRPAYMVNVGEKATPKSRHITDPEFLKAVRDFHSIDMEIYRWAEARRKATRASDEN